MVSNTLTRNTHSLAGLTRTPCNKRTLPLQICKGWGWGGARLRSERASVTTSSPSKLAGTQTRSRKQSSEECGKVFLLLALTLGQLALVHSPHPSLHCPSMPPVHALRTPKETHCSGRNWVPGAIMTEAGTVGNSGLWSGGPGIGARWLCQPCVWHTT